MTVAGCVNPRSVVLDEHGEVAVAAIALAEGFVAALG